MLLACTTAQAQWHTYKANAKHCIFRNTIFEIAIIVVLREELERGRGVMERGVTVLRTSQHFLDHFEPQFLV